MELTGRVRQWYKRAGLVARRDFVERGTGRNYGPSRRLTHGRSAQVQILIALLEVLEHELRPISAGFYELVAD
jgi:hypothetical protein